MAQLNTKSSANCLKQMRNDDGGLNKTHSVVQPFFLFYILYCSHFTFFLISYFPSPSNFYFSFLVLTNVSDAILSFSN